MHDALLARTRELIDGCPCESGCPSCVGPEGATGPLAKAVASHLLRTADDRGWPPERCATSPHAFARSSGRTRNGRRSPARLADDAAQVSTGREPARPIGLDRPRPRPHRRALGGSRHDVGRSSCIVIDRVWEPDAVARPPARRVRSRSNGRADRAVRWPAGRGRRLGVARRVLRHRDDRPRAAAPARFRFSRAAAGSRMARFRVRQFFLNGPAGEQRDARRPGAGSSTRPRCSSPSTAGRSTCR